MDTNNSVIKRLWFSRVASFSLKNLSSFVKLALKSPCVCIYLYVHPYLITQLSLLCKRIIPSALTLSSLRDVNTLHSLIYHYYGDIKSIVIVYPISLPSLQRWNKKHCNGPMSLPNRSIFLKMRLFKLKKYMSSLLLVHKLAYSNFDIFQWVFFSLAPILKTQNYSEFLIRKSFVVTAYAPLID